MIELPDWTTTELVWMRILVAALFLRYHRRPRPSSFAAPVGIAKFAPLDRVIASPLFLRAGLVSVPLFAAGVAQPAPAIVLALIALITVTVDNSDGAVSHGRHLMVLVLGANAVAETAYWIEREFDRSWNLDPGLAPIWSVHLIAAMYFTAGAMKVINTGGLWAVRGERFELQVLKGDYNASLQRGPIGERFARFSRRNPAMIRVALVGGLVVELFTPLALLHPVAMFAVGCALIVLHRANGILLQLPFSQNQGLIAIYLVLFSLPLG